jgi:hypothetical protein
VGVHTSLLSQKPFSFLPTSDQDRMIQVQMLAFTKECFCTERNTLRPWFAQSELDGNPLFSVTRLLDGWGGILGSWAVHTPI